MMSDEKDKIKPPEVGKPSEAPPNGKWAVS